MWKSKLFNHVTLRRLDLRTPPVFPESIMPSVVNRLMDCLDTEAG